MMKFFSLDFFSSSCDEQRAAAVKSDGGGGGGDRREDNVLRLTGHGSKWYKIYEATLFH